MCKKPSTALQAGVCLNCRKNYSSFENNSQLPANHSFKPSFGQQPSKPSKIPNSNADPNAICRHFLEGNCKFGNNCKYTHAVIFNKPNQGQVTNPKGPKGMLPANNQQSSGPAQQAANFNSKPSCLFFAKGYCKNGSNCNFKHG